VVARAGSVLLVETVRKSGLDSAISASLAPWRKRRAVHDPGKIPLDVALALVLGGDCLADVGMLRAEPAVFGPVDFDPTVSRLVDPLDASGPKAPTAFRAARGSPLRGQEAPLAVVLRRRPARHHRLPPLAQLSHPMALTDLSPTRPTGTTPCQTPADQ
jgi:hypothetical protein